MRFGKVLCFGVLLSTLSGCSLLEDYLASAIEATVVPSAIADNLGAVTQNLMAANNLDELDVDICPDEPIPGCVTGEKNISLNNCQVQDPFSFKGSLDFSFLDADDASINDCKIDTAGDKIVREFAAQLKGYEAITISITGDSNGAGGGYAAQGQQTLTQGADALNWTFSSTGIHRRGSASTGVFSLTPLDLSTRTGTAFNVTLSANPADPFEADGGTIILHNRAGSDAYNVELATTAKLIYDKCNCPTSGKLEGAATGGGLSGSAADMSLEFISCGIAHFTFRGELHENVKLDMCVGL
ncbi:MAG: hypothetical protein M9899_07900 [Bdellovibrionaceae bacterium]|nr:hypothetical protein [Pseudobdellovibrionaceae bacterium]